MRNLSFELFLVIAWAAVLTGCIQEKRLEAEASLQSISARVYDAPIIGLKEIEFVRIPNSEVVTFSKMISPKSKIDMNLPESKFPHVADIFLYYADGKRKTLIVRWTGHNPAALSFDGLVYYWADDDGKNDGGLNLLRMLKYYSTELENEAD